MQDYSQQIKSKMCSVIGNMKNVLTVKDVQDVPQYHFNRVDAFITVKGHGLPIGVMLRFDMKNDKYMYLDIKTEYRDSFDLQIGASKSVFLAYYFHKLQKVFVINIREFISWINSDKQSFEVLSTMYGFSVKIPINRMLKEFTKITVLSANIEEPEKIVEKDIFENVSSYKIYNQVEIATMYPGIDVKNPEDIPHNGPQRIVLNNQTYGNLLYALGFTYDELKKWLSFIKYDNPKTSKDKKESSIAEADIGWPSFVLNFYECMEETMHNMLPPTEEDYVNYYLYKNRKVLKELIKKNSGKESQEEILENLTGRLKRTYPSIIRDISACLLLDKQGKPAFYNCLVDYHLGCDCVLYYPSIQYGLNMYMSTSRAFKNRARKEKKFPEELIKIEWPMHSISYDEYLKDVLAIYNEKDTDNLEKIIKDTLYKLENT